MKVHTNSLIRDPIRRLRCALMDTARLIIEYQEAVTRKQCNLKQIHNKVVPCGKANVKAAARRDTVWHNS